MSKPLIITPQAQNDFDSAFRWYEEEYPGLGKDFGRCVDVTFSEVQRNPHHFQFIFDNKVRRAIISRFPYCLFFMELEEAISVFAITHQSRNPDFWMRRV